MAKFKIWGASDDLIEVEGLDPASAKIGEEFNAYDGPRSIVLLPSRDVFTVHYGKDGRGVWSVEHTVVSGQLAVSIERAPEGDDPDPYTDAATVEGLVERVEMWLSWPPTPAQIREKCGAAIEHAADERAAREWSVEKALAVIAAIEAP